MCVPCSITICCISAYTIIIWLLQCTRGGEESPWMTASHWRQKQTTNNKFFRLLSYTVGYYTSHSVTAHTSTSWVTHVLFVATTRKVIFTQIVHSNTIIVSNSIPLLTPLIDPNWINSELAIALVKIFKNIFILTQNFQLSHLHHHYFHNFCMIHLEMCFTEMYIALCTHSVDIADLRRCSF